MRYLPCPDDPTAITHRVVAITHAADGGRVFTVQGDANSAPDDPVQDQHVRARVWYVVPWLGTVNDIVNGDARGALVVTAAVGFFLRALTLFRRAWRERRRGEDPAQDAEGDTERDGAESLAQGQGAAEVREPGARRVGRAA